jgi:antitoxin ParD1/3/4
LSLAEFIHAVLLDAGVLGHQCFVGRLEDRERPTIAPVWSCGAATAARLGHARDRLRREPRELVVGRPLPVPLRATVAFHNCVTFVQQRGRFRGMATTIGFRPTDEDERIIKSAMRPDERTSDVIRRALRLLDREVWLSRAREDAERLATEDLNAEPDKW